MTLYNNPANISETLNNRLYPSVTMWNRLEGRPRTHHFDKAMKAEVRDALWMLCKQWQMGEFKGDDAGSPVFSKIKVNSSQITEYNLGNNPTRPLNELFPMECLVEQKEIPFERNGNKISLDVRLQLGRFWHKLLKSKSLGGYYLQFVENYGFNYPSKQRSTDYIHAHKEELQQWMAVSGRCIDGFEIIKDITDNSPAFTNIAFSNLDDEVTLNEIGEKLINFYEQNFMQSKEESAWFSDRLEYKMACVTENGPNKNTLKAEEYYHGHLDWHSFNLETSTSSGNNVDISSFKDIFIPTHVEFDGMPDNRWWKFEDSKTDFGDISPSTTDLSKLLLIEFGLTFANDWFLVPFTLPIGSVSEIEGLSVTNNFGEVFWIQATEKGGAAIHDWSIFRQTSSEVNKKLFLCPSAIKVQEGQPLEDIWFVRDEMANMVWGVEKLVPSSLGKGVQGGEYGLQKRKFHESIVGSSSAADIDFAASVYYNAMTEVPENWIPFIPVHANGHKRQIQLQRASMLRIITGDSQNPEKIKPMTSVLREGLEAIPKPVSYFIHEEEITRSGTRIIQSFQRTRWLNGQVYVWLGSKKKTGRGEGSSGLAFDQLENSKEQ